MFFIKLNSKLNIGQHCYVDKIVLKSSYIRNLLKGECAICEYIIAFNHVVESFPYVTYSTFEVGLKSRRYSNMTVMCKEQALSINQFYLACLNIVL